MELSTKHQELLDSIYPDGYEIKSGTAKGGLVYDEHDNYHILFIKIIPQPGQHENKLVPMVQKYTPRDWDKAYQMIEKFGIGGVTQQDEFAIIHDPVKYKLEAEAKEKEAVKKAEEKKLAAEVKKKAAEEKKAEVAKKKMKAEAEKKEAKKSKTGS